MSIKEIKKLAKETLNSSLENSAIVTALYMAFIAIMLFAKRFKFKNRISCSYGCMWNSIFLHLFRNFIFFPKNV